MNDTIGMESKGPNRKDKYTSVVGPRALQHGRSNLIDVDALTRSIVISGGMRPTLPTASVGMTGYQTPMARRPRLFIVQ
jgi:hypothetical protein